MQEIAKDVYQIPLLPRDGINAYIANGYLIDAGIRSSGKKLLAAVDTYGRDKIKAHILTHAHPDHQGATAFICDTLKIPLWCGKGDVTAMENGLIPAEEMDRANVIIRLQQRFWTGPPYPVTRTLKEGDHVGSFRVLETPGHSAGHIALWRAEDGVLIAGDVVVNMNLLTTAVGLHQPPAMFTSNIKQNQASIIKLAKLHPKVICLGHGPPLTHTKELHDLAQSLPEHPHLKNLSMTN
jgi:glyoxylase-like metal-dependent hydrolase (beta-lactamase superfamily II)